MELTETGRDGALTKFRITDAAHLRDEMPHTGYTVSVDNNDIVGKASKKDLRALRAWIIELQAPEQAEKAVRGDNAPRRVLVPAGSVQVGEQINGYTVQGLGRDFYPNEDQFSQWGIHPSYCGAVQYAYFN